MTTTHTFVERPILFRGDMVRAILEGRKTQTRRVMKPGPPPCQTESDAVYQHLDGWRYAGCDYTGDVVEKCPYGKPGDRLWVRETWAAHAPPGQQGNYLTGQNVTYVYKASHPLADIAAWRPSIFMPRLACRIKLEITGVRVERLDDIIEADALAEGACGRAPEDAFDSASAEFRHFFRDFRKLKPTDNPWLWVVDFRRIP